MQTTLLGFALRSLPLRFPYNKQTLKTTCICQNRLYSNVANGQNEKESTAISSKTESGVSDIAATPDDSNAARKLIKVAVIGVPNAGKSSFINQIMDRRVCPTSRKVHTTRTFSKTILNRKKSQMILFDTPGLVTGKEMKKHKLSSTFISSCRHSIQHANLIAVIQDVSNSHTRNALHSTVLDTLQEYNHLPSILVLNKIDMLKSKRILLDLVNILTEKTLVYRHRRFLPWAGTEREFIKDMERPVKYKNEKSAGWPGFSEVFMVSSLTGDGMHHVREHILNQSIVKPWEYTNGEFTDQPTENVIVDNVRAALLDYLPNEIPYNLTVEMEYFDEKKDTTFAYVNVVCPSERIVKLICGGKNSRIDQITETANSELMRLYNRSVSLVVQVTSHEKTKGKKSVVIHPNAAK